MEKRSGGLRALIFVAVAGAVSGYLVFQSKSTEEAGGGPVTPAPAPRQEVELASGDQVTTVPLLSLSGESLELKGSGNSRPLLLYVFSPTCGICRETLPSWKEIFPEAESLSAEVLGLSVLDPPTTQQYVDQNDMPWRVYCLAGRDGYEALRVHHVPLTAVLERSGRVAWAKTGRLDDQDREDILEALRRLHGG